MAKGPCSGLNLGHLARALGQQVEQLVVDRVELAADRGEFVVASFHDAGKMPYSTLRGDA